MCLMSLLINLRVLAEQYVFAAAQAACLSSDVGGPSAGSIRKKEGPRPGSIRIRRAITAWNTSQHWFLKVMQVVLMQRLPLVAPALRYYGRAPNSTAGTHG